MLTIALNEIEGYFHQCLQCVLDQHQEETSSSFEMHLSERVVRNRLHPVRIHIYVIIQIDKSSFLVMHDDNMKIKNLTICANFAMTQKYCAESLQ